MSNFHRVLKDAETRVANLNAELRGIRQDIFRTEDAIAEVVLEIEISGNDEMLSDELNGLQWDLHALNGDRERTEQLLSDAAKTLFHLSY